MKYLAIPVKQLTDAVADFETAQKQAEEMVNQYGRDIGDIAVVEFRELGKMIYSSPFWDGLPHTTPKSEKVL